MSKTSYRSLWWYPGAQVSKSYTTVGTEWPHSVKELVVKHSTTWRSALKKRHDSFAYHQARQAWVARIIRVAQRGGDTWIGDLLTKLCQGLGFNKLFGYVIWHLLYDSDWVGSDKTPGILDAMVTKMEAKHPFFFLFYIQPYNTAGCAAASANGRCDD